MRNRVAASLAAAFLTAAAAANANEQVVLKFGFANPPGTWSKINGVDVWAKDVEARSGGKLQVQVFAGGSVVNQRNTYDRTINGVVDAAYGPFGAISSDQMPRIDVTALPFESPGIIESSAAAWALFKGGYFNEDFARIRVFTSWCMPPTGLHTSKEVRKLEDFRGMKLTAATRPTGEIVERLGATVVSITNPEVYQAIQRGTAQGLLLPDSGIITFHLQEVTKYHINLALGCTQAGFFMNKEFYARQPAELKAALDDASGDAFAKHMAKAALNEDHVAHQKIHSQPGAVLVKLQPQELARWNARLKPITEEWVKTTPDGAKVLGAFRAEIAKQKAGS